MWVDNLTLLSDAQAFTADAVSTNSYDTGVAGGNDVSVGEPLCVVITFDVAAIVNDTDETYDLEVIQSAAAALTSPDKLVVVPFTNALAVSLLTVGAIIVIPIPPGSITKRYLGMNYNVGGTTPGATVTAFITSLSQVQKDKRFADSVTIS